MNKHYISKSYLSVIFGSQMRGFLDNFLPILPPILVTTQARLLFLHLVQVFEYFVQSSLTTEVYFTVPEFDLG